MSPIMKCVICETTDAVSLIQGERLCNDNSCRTICFNLPSDDEESDDEECKCAFGCGDKATIALACDNELLHLREEFGNECPVCQECGEGYLTDYPNHYNRPYY